MPASKSTLVLLVFAIFLTMTSISARAQQQTVTFQPEKPTPGDTVTIMYHPERDDAKITSPDSLKLVFSYAPNQYGQPDSLMMQKTNQGWRASVPLSDQFTFASFYFKSGDMTDKNSNGHHYELMAYKDGKPVEKAYQMKARSLAKRYEDISKQDLAAMAAGYQLNEVALYPQNFMAQLKVYSQQLSRPLVDSATVLHNIRQLVDEKLAHAPLSTSDMNKVRGAYHTMNEKAESDSVKKAMIKQYPHSDFAMYDLFQKAYSEKDSVKQNQMLQEYTRTNYEQSWINKYYTGLAYKKMFENYAKQDSLQQMMNMAELWLKPSSRKFKNPMKTEDYNTVAETIAKDTDQYDVAMQYISKALSLTDKEPVSRGYAINEGGIQPLYMPENKREEEYNKRKADILSTKGLIEIKKKKYDQAEQTLDQAMKLDAENEDAQKYLAELYTKTNRPKQAFATYKKMLMKKPTDKDLRKQLKESYIAYNGSVNGFKKQTKELHRAWRKKMRKKFKEEMISKQAPSLAHATDLEGTPMDTTALAGKVVILDFWATWCGPCKSSFPHMQKVYEKYEDNPGVKFVIMNSAWSNSIKDARKWAKKQDYTFPYFYDKGSKIISAYGVTGIPTTFVLGRDGNIKFKDVGYSGPSMEPKLSLKIEMLLDEQEKR